MRNQVKNISKVGVITAIAVMTILVVNPIEAEAKTRLSKKNITLAVGKTYTLKTKGTKVRATWRTNKKAIARISKKKRNQVRITAVKAGRTVVSAKINGKTYKCKVRVVNPKLDRTKATLTVGQTTTLKVTGGTGKIAWKTSNANIATVTNKGVVTARKAGTTRITATVNDKVITAVVTVRASNASSDANRPATPTPAPKPVTPPISTPIPPKSEGTGISITPTRFYIDSMNYTTRTYYHSPYDFPEIPGKSRVWVETPPVIINGKEYTRSTSQAITIRSHGKARCKGCGEAFFTTSELFAHMNNNYSVDSDYYPSWETISVIDEWRQENTIGGKWEYTITDSGYFNIKDYNK